MTYEVCEEAQVVCNPIRRVPQPQIYFLILKTDYKRGEVQYQKTERPRSTRNIETTETHRITHTLNRYSIVVDARCLVSPYALA